MFTNGGDLGPYNYFSTGHLFEMPVLSQEIKRHVYVVMGIYLTYVSTIFDLNWEMLQQSDIIFIFHLHYVCLLTG